MRREIFAAVSGWIISGEGENTFNDLPGGVKDEGRVKDVHFLEGGGVVDRHGVIDQTHDLERKLEHAEIVGVNDHDPVLDFAWVPHELLGDVEQTGESIEEDFDFELSDRLILSPCSLCPG